MLSTGRSNGVRPTVSFHGMTHMIVQQPKAYFAYTYFAPPTGRMLHDGWRSV